MFGFGSALFSSPNANAIMGSVEKRFYGLASGSVGTMRLLGMMISMGIATLIFSIFIGRVQITVEYYAVFLKGMKAAFIIFAILCFGGIFASLARGRLRARRLSENGSLARSSKSFEGKSKIPDFERGRQGQNGPRRSSSLR